MGRCYPRAGAEDHTRAEKTTFTGSATSQKSRDRLFVYFSIASPSQIASKCLQFVVLVTITMGVMNGDHGGWPMRPPIGQKKRASS